MIENIIELLNEKRELFMEYKNVLLKMLDCPPEDMADYSENLDILKDKIDRIDKEIKNLCNLLGQAGDDILFDIKNKSKRDEVSDQRKEVFDIAQNTYTIIYGMNSIIEQIKLKANQNMNQAMKKIKELTTTGKSVQYLKSFDSGFEKGTFLNIKK